MKALFAILSAIALLAMPATAQRAISATQNGTAGTVSWPSTSLIYPSGYILSWNAGDLTLTHSADVLTLAGGSFTMAGGMTVNVVSAYDSGHLMTWNAGDVTLTHSSNALTLNGGEFFVPTEAYSTTNWNGDLSVPTKDALRDMLVLGDTDGDGKADVIDIVSSAGFMAVTSGGVPVQGRTFTEGTAIDISNPTGAAGDPTFDFDPTELTGDRTWAAGGAASITWTWNNSGTDPALVFGNGTIGVTGTFTSSGVAALGTTISSTTALNLPASTTGVSSARLAHGSAPSSPVNGDLWTTTSGLFARINGSTVGPFAAAGGSTTWDAIGDAAADGSIGQAGFELDWTSTLDSAGKSIWTITNTDADTAAATSFIELRHNDGADVDVQWLKFVSDNDGTPSTDLLFTQTGFTLSSAIATRVEGSFFVGGNAQFDVDVDINEDLNVDGTFTVATIDVTTLNATTFNPTTLTLPNGAAPTVDAFGEIAGDNNAWAASRGAVVFYDGTAETRLVGALSSDTPSNGQVPTWNTGGTITWETPSGSGTVTVVSAGNLTSTAFVTGGGTQTLQTPSATSTLDSSGNAVFVGTGSATRFLPTGSTIPTNGFYLPAANTLGWGINSAEEMRLTGTALSPGADGGNSLGTTALGWQNLFGNTGFVINIENSDWVATHTTGILTVGTGDLRVTTAGTNSASVVTVGGSQTLTGKSIVASQITAGTLPAASLYLLGENSSVGLDPAGSADGKWSGISVTGTAGYTQAFGDLVYLDPTDSRWEAVDANSAAAADGDARGLIGMVVSTGTDGTACTLLLQGIIRADANFPTLTVGAPVYAAETAGDVVVTQPVTADVVIRVVGHALTADEFYFNPSGTWTTHN